MFIPYESNLFKETVFKSIFCKNLTQIELRECSLIEFLLEDYLGQPSLLIGSPTPLSNKTLPLIGSPHHLTNRFINREIIYHNNTFFLFRSSDKYCTPFYFQRSEHGRQKSYMYVYIKYIIRLNKLFGPDVVVDWSERLGVVAGKEFELTLKFKNLA